MPLSPILVVGCGGSGGKVVLGLRRRLQEELQRRKWAGGLPAAWQFKWIDLPTVQESHGEFGPPLPQRDYISLADGVAQYSMIDAALMARASGQTLERVVGWRPTPTLSIPVNKGASQMRAIGRTVALTKTDSIRRLVQTSLDDISGGVQDLAQLSEHLGGSGDVDPTPAVFVVSSMAGGTGAGVYMDVCDVIRGYRPEVGPSLFGILFTAEIFQHVNADAGMVPNTVASVGELMSGYFAADRGLEPLYGPIGAISVSGQSGPTIPLVVGMQPLGGGQALESPGQCYRAVTETLVAVAVNEDFQQRFVGYQVTNWTPNADVDKRITGYAMLNQPRIEGAGVRPCGVVSSFGSSMVSVGAGRFGEWARHRLTRAVVDHLKTGWRDKGRQLMGSMVSPMTTDQDIVEFLVSRDRNEFVRSCGLWEENEPNGTEHNDVLDGIMPLAQLGSRHSAFESTLLDELARTNTQRGQADWTDTIMALTATRQGMYLADLEAHLFSAREEFCGSIGRRLAGAVSDWLSRFGIPVTRGLVDELEAQCRTAVEQLKADQQHFKTSADQDVRNWVLASFNALGKGTCAANSEFVRAGLDQALGPLKFRSMQRRHDEAISTLERVVDRVIRPVKVALDDVGGLLAAPDIAAELNTWPDDRGDVPPVYRPAPSELVLVGHADWGRLYAQLLEQSAGSTQDARDLVARGGFEYGPLVSPKVAPLMVEMRQNAKWWERDAGVLDINVRLRPADVLDRVQMWMLDDRHPLGKFIQTGLQEYLGEAGEQRHERLQRFEVALSRAVELARPLVRIEPAMMQRVHTQKPELSLDLVCEPFPFPSTMTEVRQIVERVMFGQKQPDGGWFMASNTNGVESVLITSVLDAAVQPAAVTSLTGPIAQRWSVVRSNPQRSAAIAGFQTYNRARPLNECVPLTAPALLAVSKGWFLGRSLGAVSNATENEPFVVSYKSPGGIARAALPWPVLRHGAVPELHSTAYGAEWLPALLEHLPLTMMMLGDDPRALDGFEQLFQLGQSANTHVQAWVLDGATPTGTRCELHDKVTDSHGPGAPEERKKLLDDRLDSVMRGLDNRRRETVLLPEWKDFIKVPYGYELIPTFQEALSSLIQITATVETGTVSW
jgi:hypothetical protein